MFLRPIINGTGNYYIEAQTRDARRTDVIETASPQIYGLAVSASYYYQVVPY